MNNIAVILARGGSKRLPGKNWKSFNGTSLVGKTIQAAQGALCCDRVIVSTDDHHIAEIAFGYGTLIHVRDEDTAGDDATSYQALFRVIHDFRMHDDNIILLQPTSPLRTSADIDGTWKLASQMRHNLGISVETGRKAANGAVYIGSADWLLSGGNWDDAPTAKYDMPKERSHDIDTQEDWDRALTDA